MYIATCIYACTNLQVTYYVHVGIVDGKDFSTAAMPITKTLGNFLISMYWI